MTTTKETIAATAAQLGITMTAEFIPFSRSRNKGEKSPSLNWTIVLHSNGREFLRTDYSAGCGHCPAYKASIAELGGRNCLLRDGVIRWECENGRMAPSGFGGYTRTAPILPELADVLHSLCSDASALDYASFDDWAGDYGLDVDSRKAEHTYRECLAIGLKLRAGIGEEGLRTLREALQDY